jgi:hypothetical protein
MKRVKMVTNFRQRYLDTGHNLCWRHKSEAEDFEHNLLKKCNYTFLNSTSEIEQDLSEPQTSGFIVTKYSL